MLLLVYCFSVLTYRRNQTGCWNRRYSCHIDKVFHLRDNSCWRHYNTMSHCILLEQIYQYEIYHFFWFINRDLIDQEIWFVYINKESFFKYHEIIKYGLGNQIQLSDYILQQLLMKCTVLYISCTNLKFSVNIYKDNGKCQYTCINIFCLCHNEKQKRYQFVNMLGSIQSNLLPWT